MNTPQEFSGRTIEEAIAEGLKALQRERHEVDIEVVQYPRRKFLGRVDAVVSMQSLGPRTENLDEAEETVPQPVVTGQPEPVRATEPEPAAAHANSEPELDTPRVPEATAAQSAVVAPEGYEEVERVALATLTRLLDYMDLQDFTINQTWATDTRDQPVLTLHVEGERLGRLIGRHGVTLSSLQSIVRLMLGQNLDRRPYVNVDVDGYQRKQQQALTRKALKIAEDVVTRGHPYEMEPLSAVNRRIVHMALQNHPDVYTESEGSGSERRVVIYLK